MNLRVGQFFLFCVFLISCSYSCRKHDVAAPTLRTRDIEGSYVLRGTAIEHRTTDDTTYDTYFVSSITVVNDTTLSVGINGEIFKYTPSTNSELVYCNKGDTIRYDFIMKTLTWYSYGSFYNGDSYQTIVHAPVPEQTSRWEYLVDQMAGNRLWHRKMHVYLPPKYKDSLIILPDTIYDWKPPVRGEPSGYGDFYLAGADSAFVALYKKYYDNGPNQTSIIGKILYFPLVDSISTSSKSPYRSDPWYESTTD